MLPLTPVSSGRPARLVTRRLLLRWLTADSAAELAPLCPGLARLVGHASVLVVTGRTDPAPLGLVRLAPADGEDVRLEVALLPAHRGQGLATEALTAVAEWAESELGPPRLVAGAPDAATARLLQRAGFVPDGEAGRFVRGAS